MSENLGAKLRAAREEKRMSLRSLASEIGVSPSLLSQVENGKTKPSVSTLYALVSHLDISTDALLGREESTAHQTQPEPAAPRAYPAPQHDSEMFKHVAADEHPKLEMENGVHWEKLSILDAVDVEALRVTYQPKGSSSIEGRLMRHLGVEHFYILSGELTLHLDFDTHIIRAGDSAAFDARRPHLFVNHGNEPAIGIWYITGRKAAKQHSGAVPESVLPASADVELHSAVDVLRAFRD